MFVTKRSGERAPLDMSKYERQIDWCCADLPGVSATKLKERARRPLHDGISTKELSRHLIITMADLITIDEPNWTYAAARGVLQELFKAVTNDIIYPSLQLYLNEAHTNGKVNDRLVDAESFDFEALNAAVNPKRDFLFEYLGIQTLADRYLLRTQKGDRVIEMPQHFFMRVAMGVALDETTREARTTAAIDYYEVLSNLEALSSTPTLFNSGTRMQQLSSCFGSKMEDSLDGIMDTLKEMASYSKMAGGCSMDVGGIRAKGSRIASTGGKAGGPIPYINTYDSILRGFDQSGKRKGSGSFYMETWHADIDEYLKLKDPGGDPRLRAHDAFPAFMISDLFMERVLEGGYWSLFCPNEAKGLHDTYGEEFRKLYLQYEASGIARKVVPADELWNTILEKCYQHGVFWPCFKDTINERYAQVKTGIVNHSNLCTEITLRDNGDTSFVCNLASVNLSRIEFQWDSETKKLAWNPKLAHVVGTMVKFLDSVVTLGLIPHPKGRKFQDEDRAVGLGVMGWTVALSKLGIEYESKEHVHFSSELYKQISLTATYTSALLAKDRGTYPTFAQSTWAQGKLIQDTWQPKHRQAMERRGYIFDTEDTDCPFISFAGLRELVKQGMRNSCLLAIAPTATIANIAGTTQCTEVPWDLQSRKENLSGEFNVFAHTVLNNPKRLVMKAARDIDHRWTMWAAAARQIWIDQSQSTNGYLNPTKMTPSQIGEYLDDLYMEAWACGVKTTYYIYSQSAEVTTLVTSSPGAGVTEKFDAEAEGPACFMRPGDPGFEDCEACQ